MSDQDTSREPELEEVSRRIKQALSNPSARSSSAFCNPKQSGYHHYDDWDHFGDYYQTYHLSYIKEESFPLQDLPLLLDLVRTRSESIQKHFFEPGILSHEDCYALKGMIFILRNKYLCNLDEDLASTYLLAASRDPRTDLYARFAFHLGLALLGKENEVIDLFFKIEKEKAPLKPSEPYNRKISRLLRTNVDKVLRDQAGALGDPLPHLIDEWKDKHPSPYPEEDPEGHYIIMRLIPFLLAKQPQAQGELMAHWWLWNHPNPTKQMNTYYRCLWGFDLPNHSREDT